MHDKERITIASITQQASRDAGTQERTSRPYRQSKRLYANGRRISSKNEYGSEGTQSFRLRGVSPRAVSHHEQHHSRRPPRDTAQDRVIWGEDPFYLSTGSSRHPWLSKCQNSRLYLGMVKKLHDSVQVSDFVPFVRCSTLSIHLHSSIYLTVAYYIEQARSLQELSNEIFCPRSKSLGIRWPPSAEASRVPEPSSHPVPSRQTKTKATLSPLIPPRSTIPQGGTS